MVVTEVLGNIKDREVSGTVVPVPFEWFELEKKVGRRTAGDGREIGLQLTDHLHDGDILLEDGEKTYAVSVTESELIAAAPGDPDVFGRLCYELGNRHLPVRIEGGAVVTPYDEPTYSYLKTQGFPVGKRAGKFTGFSVVRAHSHDHPHG